MFAHSFRAGLGATATVALSLALAVAGPATADPSFTPSATDFVGVGSDTTQIVMTDLATGYNSTVTGSNPKVASFDACVISGTTCTPGGQITLRTGSAAITRPNGSGAGKNLLFSGTNNPDVTFARSSSGISTAEQNAGLVAYPFALDTLVMVTSATTPSNAPSALNGQQILGIYTGSITNWSQVDATKSGVIKPLIPQTGSGTRSFFIAQLTALNNGTAPTLAGTVTEVQEHDPTLVKNDPNAVAPFSKGRADSSVRIETGYKAGRAIYNVVRSLGTNAAWNAGSPEMEALFGSNGYLCSVAARSIIEANGFKQLKSPTDTGACGVPTTTSTPNLTVYNPDVSGTPTSTSVALSPGTATYGQGSSASITVTGAAGVPTGTVTLSTGSFTGQATLSAGGASIAIPALPAGSNTVTVSYSGDSTFNASTGSSTLQVTRATSTTTATFPKVVKKKKKTTGTVTITAPAGVPTGTVIVRRGSKVVGTGTVVNGRATVHLKALKKGKNTLVVSYSGNANISGSSTTITIKQK